MEFQDSENLSEIPTGHMHNLSRKHEFHVFSFYKLVDDPGSVSEEDRSWPHTTYFQQEI